MMTVLQTRHTCGSYFRVVNMMMSVVHLLVNLTLLRESWRPSLVVGKIRSACFRKKKHL